MLRQLVKVQSYSLELQYCIPVFIATAKKKFLLDFSLLSCYYSRNSIFFILMYRNCDPIPAPAHSS